MNSWNIIDCTAMAWLFWALLPCGLLVAQEPNSTDDAKRNSVDYARDVQPIFVAHCYSCHGTDKQESSFRLDIKSHALGAGDIGDPPIVPGNSKLSLLISYISGKDADLVMPPAEAAKGLSAENVEALRRWIDEGANWPDELANESVGDGGRIKMTTDHWSFQPVADYPLPVVDPVTTGAFPLRNGIDHFIAARLALNGIRPSERADRVSFIRRIYLDMHGLQPTPEQVRAFVNDNTEEAYSNLIDQVLESHHYGERWARHWLDVVRFGESTGYEVNRDRANAYFYRDYVIKSLNEDKSFRDFIIEQLAGDAVGVDEATGFLVGGAYDIVKSPDINLTLMQREDELADYVNTTSTAFLGLTVGCARCHNHKFDPILQSDYYSFQAVFAGVEHGERQLASRIPKEVRESLAKTQAELKIEEDKLAEMRVAFPRHESSEPLLSSVNAKLNTDRFDAVKARFLRFTIHRTNQSEPCIDELEVYSATDDTNVALASLGSTVKSSGDYQNNPKHKLEHINDGNYGNDFSWISNTQGSGWVQIEFAETVEINRVVWGRERNGAFADRLAIGYSISISTDEKNWQEVSGSSRREPFTTDGKESDEEFISRLTGDDAAQAKKLVQSSKQLREQVSKLKQSMPVGYVGKFKTPAATRRLYRGDPMSPREEVAPDILTVMGSLEMKKDEAEQSRRLKLAQWIAADDNPLTARVIVNRVWHYHFGRGIVSTPSDFGKNGVAPTHPQLLDWLTIRFVENEWSLKWLHREILSSSTYQQSSRARTEAIAKDADCKWLWRFPPRRLEAEAIRDCMLQLTGKLNPKAGGPGFLLFKIDRENVHHYFPLEEFGPEHFRRMIYMTKIRQEQDEVFGVFDCPDGGQTIPNRNRSTTALQALNMLNSKFVIDQSRFLAERLKADAGEKTESQVQLAFDLAFSRLPSDEEMNDACGLVNEHGLAAFCRAMLNANELLFVR